MTVDNREVVRPQAEKTNFSIFLSIFKILPCATQNRKLVFSSEDSAKLDFVGDTQASYDSGITLNSDFENHKEPQISNFLVR